MQTSIYNCLANMAPSYLTSLFQVRNCECDLMRFKKLLLPKLATTILDLTVSNICLFPRVILCRTM